MPTATAKPPATAPSRRWLADWTLRVQCSTPAFETATTDPFTVQELIQEGAHRHDCVPILWDVADGFRCPEVDPSAFASALARLPYHGDLALPFNVLRAILDLDVASFAPGRRPNAVFILLNFYVYFDADDVRQQFENTVVAQALNNEARMRPVHFLQAPYAGFGLKGIEAVRHHITPMPLPLPDAAELRHGPVDDLVRTSRAEDLETGSVQEGVDYSEAHLTGLASACVGLARPRARAILYYSVAKKNGLIPGPTRAADGTTLPPLVDMISGLVAAELAASGTMEIIDAADIAAPEDIAGVEQVVAHLEEAAFKSTAEARDRFLDPARGCWLSGVEGSGKTTAAFAAAEIFRRKTGRHWKVVRVNMPAMYGGVYGETETRWFDFETRIAAFGECICVFDEVDKVFGNVMNSGGGSKVEQSLFGLWLAWAGSPSKRGKAFPILCMNDPSHIPREALREGRLDAGFYFDLPDAPTRAAVARIHFRKRLAPLGLGLDALGWSETEWEMLGEKTDQFLPGEIEVLVSRARDRAAAAGAVLPTFNQMMQLVAARLRDREGDDEAREDHVARMEAMKVLRRNCRKMGAVPARARPAAVAAAPEPTPVTRTRTRSPRADLN